MYQRLTPVQHADPASTSGYYRPGASHRASILSHFERSAPRPHRRPRPSLFAGRRSSSPPQAGSSASGSSDRASTSRPSGPPLCSNLAVGVDVERVKKGEATATRNFHHSRAHRPPVILRGKPLEVGGRAWRRRCLKCLTCPAPQDRTALANSGSEVSYCRDANPSRRRDASARSEGLGSADLDLGTGVWLPAGGFHLGTAGGRRFNPSTARALRARQTMRALGLSGPTLPLTARPPREAAGGGRPTVGGLSGGRRPEPLGGRVRAA